MKKIIICNNYRANPSKASCVRRGSEKIATAISGEIIKNNIAIEVEFFKCLGQCVHGPNIKLVPEGRFIQALTLEDIPELVRELTAFASKL